VNIAKLKLLKQHCKARTL